MDSDVKRPLRPQVRGAMGIERTFGGVGVYGRRQIMPPQTRTRRILVSNAKGGCGKSTIATNLAGFYAACGRHTALLDYDPQSSSMLWLKRRGETPKPIHGIAAHRRGNGAVTRSFLMRMPAQTERVIVDAPAGVQTADLIELLRETDTVLVPVLPSPLDIDAAAQFIGALASATRCHPHPIRVGVIANRVKESTRVYQELARFLNQLDIPFVTRFRDTQNYIRAAEQGLSIHELGSRRAEQDRIQWMPLVRWLESGDGSVS